MPGEGIQISRIRDQTKDHEENYYYDDRDDHHVKKLEDTIDN